MSPLLSSAPILWDLDGTIMDSLPGILQTITYTLTEMGHAPPKNLVSWVGPPFPHSLRTQAGFSEPEIEEAVVLFRDHYNAVGSHLSSPFPGLPELLGDLRQAGKNMATATSKPVSQATNMLKREKLFDLFDVIGAASDDETRSAKIDVVTDALDGFHAHKIDTTGVWLVGDRIHDFEAAAQLNMPSVAVTWGYGNAEEWAHATYIVTEVRQLRKLLGL